MIQGQTLLKMNGAAYFGPAFERLTTHALFAVQVSNYIPVGGGTTVLTVTIQTRKFADTGWVDITPAFQSITADGLHTLELSSDMQELLRFKYAVAATNRHEGCHVFTPAPMWLLD